jgi:tRNA-Thr(GGU) m(6)t(6)A37 methyltransferase TsaA
VSRTLVDEIRYTPVGVIRSPFKETAGMPIQAVGAKGVEGSVELAPAYHDGLRDVEGFSHLILVYHFHLARSPSLTIGPLLDHESRGVFATRSPKRPNPIGLSAVRLVGVEGGTLRIENVDVAGGTPMLDIKPYVPSFDVREDVSIGWSAGNVQRVYETRSDDRAG